MMKTEVFRAIASGYFMQLYRIVKLFSLRIVKMQSVLQEWNSELHENVNLSRLDFN